MAPITLHEPSDAATRLAHSREYALYKGIHSGGQVDSEALIELALNTGGDVGAAKEAADKGDIDFKTFASIFKAQPESADGEGNCFGWAARDPSAVLAPYRFTRRQLKPHDIFIQITHAGMCHSDLHTINGDWGPAKYPVVPGHEIVGIVVEVGAEVTKFKPGDRAGVGVFVDSCKDCKFCNRHDELFCAKAVMTYNAVNFDGTPAQGGYSTHIVVEDQYALTIPANLPLSGVAPLLCAGITTWTPYKEYGLDKKGYKIGVNGLGGLGHMAVKWGVAFGCEVVVLSRSKAKEADALKLGASRILVSTDEAAMKEEAGTFNGIIDTVSAAHDLNALLTLLEPKGKLVVVGLPPGETVPISHFQLIQRALTFGGSLVGQLRDLQDMLNFCGENNVVSEVEVVKADYVNTAMERMAKGDVKFRFVIDVLGSMHA